MLRVAIEQARPGMPLALPVHHPDHVSRVLLQSGTMLTDRSIQRLVDQSIREIWIAWPGLEFIREHVNPRLDHSHREFTKRLSKVFDVAALDLNAVVDYSPLKNSVSDFLEKLLESPRAAFYLSELMGSETPLLRHASAVCLMSLLIGLKLGGYLVQQRKRLEPREAANIVNLGVGAMLHDVGMMHIRQDVIDRFHETEDDTDEEWRQHVFIGYRMVSGRIDPTAAASVLHHHQRFDGKGFPEVETDDILCETEGREGEAIHVFPRIIAAADLFDRIRYRGGDKPCCTRVRALRLLRDAPYAPQLDPVILSGLFAVTPPYPPGSIVTLNTGDRAVVTSWTPKDPCRPEVRLIGGLDKPPTDMTVGLTIDLRKARHTHIAYAEGADVTKDNFTPDMVLPIAA